MTTVAKDPRYARYLKMVQVVSQLSYHSLGSQLFLGETSHTAVSERGRHTLCQ